MNNKYYLWLTLCVTLVGCERLETDLLQAPNDSELDRYGLESVKLGDKQTDATTALNALLDRPLQCQKTITGLDNSRKTFALTQCQAAGTGEVGHLWNERLTALSATFVENQLCELRLQLKTSGDYEALYDQYGKKILNLFGKPDDSSAKSVRWQREGDVTTLQDLGDGKVSLQITNQRVMQALHHRGE